jgi:hypothetical protein
MLPEGPIRLPYLRLIQATSTEVSEGAKPGTFRNSLTGEDLGNQVEIIPITAIHTRHYFINREVSCWSPDAVVGQGDPGGECKVCPLSTWHIKTAEGTFKPRPVRGYRLKKGEAIVPPECSSEGVFPSMVLNGLKVPGAVVFRRSGTGEGLNLYRIMVNVPKGVVLLYSQQTKNEKGNWFIPKVKVARMMTAEEYAELDSIRAEYEEAEVLVDLKEDNEEPED